MSSSCQLEPSLDLGAPCNVVSSSSFKFVITFYRHVTTIGMVSFSSFVSITPFLGYVGELNSSTLINGKIVGQHQLVHLTIVCDLYASSYVLISILSDFCSKIGFLFFLIA